MKKIVASIVAAVAAVYAAHALDVPFERAFAALAEPTAVPAPAAAFGDGKGLFNRRLGMFVHWGIYSVNGWHEQEEWRRKMSRAEYEKSAEKFTAEKFDADAFVDAAESLGAEYIVMTAKHHDGFCMWDTATTDFKVTNTPAKRDVIKELSEACRRRGMKLGFYYSNPDWHHSSAHNPASSHQIPLQPGDEPDMEKYVAYVKAQVTELLTNYGEIVCFFWDIPTHVARPEMDELVRKLQPGIVVNDRGWGNKATCDYSTPEREVPAGACFPRPTEACDSVGACSWGYRANEDYRTAGYLARAIDATLSRGGNFLLNVGPKPDGTIPEEALGLLAKTGAWYRRAKESYRGASTESWLVKGEKALVTRRGTTVYVHCTDGLAKSGLDLSPIDMLPARATILNDGSPAECELVVMPGRWEAGRRTLHVRNVDAAKYADESLVVRLDFPESASSKLALDGGGRVREVLGRYVDAGRISGVVSAVSDRSGNVRFDCVGWADVEKRVPMATNTMFAVFSMTKTFNGAAIMAAIDDGAMSLDDEVSKYLPEFADVKVRETNELGRAVLVPPKRPLTIRDLVTHVSGSRFSPPAVKRAVPLREIARQMAAEPLAAHPGETFRYGNAWVDASAAALEVAVGMPYENWLEARILSPLGMRDTTFTPSPEQALRMVRAYTSDDGPLRPASDGCSKQLVFPWTEKVYPAASAGLFSTPADMARFSQMLASHGEWRGRQIISRKTFDSVFAVKQTPVGIEQPYCVGAWLYGGWFGHEGAMRTDQRANLRTGDVRIFFIQTENRAGEAFFSLKKAWHSAADAVQGTEETHFGN